MNTNMIDDMAFGYCPSGKISELREFTNVLLDEQTKREKVLVEALNLISTGQQSRFEMIKTALETLKEMGL